MILSSNVEMYRSTSDFFRLFVGLFTLIIIVITDFEGEVSDVGKYE